MTTEVTSALSLLASRAINADRAWMNTRIASFLFTITLSLTGGCASSGGAGSASETPAGASRANEGGEADGHPHEHGPAAVDDEHSAAEPSERPDAARDACAEIAEFCHGVDAASTDAHHCHVLGHSRGGGAGCDEHLEHCRTACAAAPAAAHTGHEH